jgi:nicotinamidase-related amidase
MRDFHLIVPSDCVASNTPEENRYALQHMRNVLQANVIPSSEIDWSKLRQRTD